jgi:hypothetical protein
VFSEPKPLNVKMWKCCFGAMNSETEIWQAWIRIGATRLPESPPRLARSANLGSSSKAPPSLHKTVSTSSDLRALTSVPRHTCYAFFGAKVDRSRVWIAHQHPHSITETVKPNPYICGLVCNGLAVESICQQLPTLGSYLVLLLLRSSFIRLKRKVAFLKLYSFINETINIFFKTNILTMFTTSKHEFKPCFYNIRIPR